MGSQSSCYIAQCIMNSLKFILKKDKVDCENYLHDLGGAEIPSWVYDAFDKMGKLLADLKIEESVSKACGLIS